jgi:hypothetical protein
MGAASNNHVAVGRVVEGDTSAQHPLLDYEKSSASQPRCREIIVIAQREARSYVHEAYALSLPTITKWRR